MFDEYFEKDNENIKIKWSDLNFREKTFLIITELTDPNYSENNNPIQISEVRDYLKSKDKLTKHFIVKNFNLQYNEVVSELTETVLKSYKSVINTIKCTNSKERIKALMNNKVFFTVSVAQLLIGSTTVVTSMDNNLVMGFGGLVTIGAIFNYLKPLTTLKNSISKKTSNINLNVLAKKMVALNFILYAKYNVNINDSYSEIVAELQNIDVKEELKKKSKINRLADGNFEDFI